MLEVKLNAPVGAAVLAAFLFGASTPFAKELVGEISPVLLAGLLYLGSDAGLWLFRLERLTQRHQRSDTDDTASQGKQGHMSQHASLEADAQLAEGAQPCMGALHDPAMESESVVALDTAPGNACGDAQCAQMGTAARKVVAFVRVQFVRPAPGPAATSAHRGQGIDQLLEHHRVMPVGAGDAENQRDALAVRGVGARILPPRGLATLAASMLARLRSSLPAPRNSASSNRCRRCHTPAACQSRRRRQHVMPLPKPSSWGNSSQGMPVRSTNRMPLSAISSLTRGRPPLAEGTNTGSSGSIFLNSAALSSLFLRRLMHRQTQMARLAMTGLC